MERVTATYRVETPLDVEQAAASLAGGPRAKGQRRPLVREDAARRRDGVLVDRPWLEVDPPGGVGVELGQMGEDVAGPVAMELEVLGRRWH